MRERGTALHTRFDGLMVDLDGVVWLGGDPIPGAIPALRTLKGTGTRLTFVTNDPRNSREFYASQLTNLGYPADPEDVITSCWATAELLADDERTRRGTAFVIGSPSLRREVERVGLRLHDGEDGQHADIIVVGGHEGFNYRELRIACQAAYRGARLFATNRDATFPAADGPWPATGSILAAVETAAGRRATVAGKPEPFMFEAAMRRMPSCRRVAVVGDNPSSDIAGGNAAGLSTILVGDALAAGMEQAPDHRVATLADLEPPTA